jgi:hypothetical protein
MSASEAAVSPLAQQPKVNNRLGTILWNGNDKNVAAARWIHFSA